MTLTWAVAPVGPLLRKLATLQSCSEHITDGIDALLEHYVTVP